MLWDDHDIKPRLDQVLGFEQHTIRGQKKMTVRVTLALAVMLAMALGRVRLGQKKKRRSNGQPEKSPQPDFTPKGPGERSEKKDQKTP